MKKKIVLLLVAAAITSAFAQDKPKAGDIIYGIVSDNEGPMMGVYVTERNEYDRIMAQSTTDVNGNFSFKLVNPDDRILITYPYYETVDKRIDRKYIEITMKEAWQPSMVPAFDAARNFIVRSYPPKTGEWSSIPVNIIPDNFICGYSFKPWNYNSVLPTYPPYGIFLMKDSESYMLVLRYFDNDKVRDRDIPSSDTMRINNKLADRLTSSIHKTIREADSLQSNAIQILRDGGTTIHALLPDRAAERWAEEIPDKLWNEQFRKFKHEFEPDPLLEMFSKPKNRTSMKKTEMELKAPDITSDQDQAQQDLYIPFRDQVHYGSIEELWNNMLLSF
ncbi:MAG: hypothetical protein IKZ89_01210 [Bacteroidaceae bacterium]|nr:hypothetical protein [Bacteroidaceae bacterium]